MASKSSPPSSSPLSPPPTAQIHAAVDSEDPAVVGLGPVCAAAYAKLEACLAERDRDWTACQQQVKELKECTTLLASSSSKEDKKKEKE